MRKKSGANFDELLNKEWSILTRNEHAQLQNTFKRTEQRNGGISFYDMINIIRCNRLVIAAMGIPVSQERKDKINKDIANKEIRVLDFNVLVNHAAMLKKEREEKLGGDVAQQNQYLDAFVALGGKADKGGYVNKNVLMQIIKREFELSLDIEAMIEGFQGDNLDYSAFCSIFEQDREKGEGRLASAASQRSLASQDSMKSVVISERDFQKFISQFQNQQE